MIAAAASIVVAFASAAALSVVALTAAVAFAVAASSGVAFVASRGVAFVASRGVAFVASAVASMVVVVGIVQRAAVHSLHGPSHCSSPAPAFPYSSMAVAVACRQTCSIDHH